MSAPLTKTQIAENSILDLNGRQTYLGNSFTLPMPGATLTDGTETPIAVIRNVAGSGKSLFFMQQIVSTDANNCLVRFYLNPTLNVPGSTTSARGLRSGSTTASISTCYLGATITANGTLLYALPADASGTESTVLYVLDPGDTLLMTAEQPTVTTTNVYVMNAWYEI